MQGASSSCSCVTCVAPGCGGQEVGRMLLPTTWPRWMLCYLRAIPGCRGQATCSVALVLNLGSSSLSDPLQVWPSVKLTYRGPMFLEVPCFFPVDLEKPSSKELGLRAANASPIIFGKLRTLGKARGPLHGM